MKVMPEYEKVGVEAYDALLERCHATMNAALDAPETLQAEDIAFVQQHAVLLIAMLQQCVEEGLMQRDHAPYIFSGFKMRAKALGIAYRSPPYSESLALAEMPATQAIPAESITGNILATNGQKNLGRN